MLVSKTAEKIGSRHEKLATRSLSFQALDRVVVEDAFGQTVRTKSQHA